MTGIDASLISLCLKQDERALHQLYRHCYSMMKGIALRYVFDKNCTGEVVNTGFLKIVNGLDKYDINQPFAPWAATIVIRVALDHVRKVMRSTSHTTDLYEDMTRLNGIGACHNLADARFDAQELLEMLERLPNQTKVVFNLFAIDGYSHKEIAAQLQISEGTSKWHVSKARERLQKEITSKMKTNKSDYEPSHR